MVHILKNLLHFRLDEVYFNILTTSINLLSGVNTQGNETQTSAHRMKVLRRQSKSR